MREILCRGFHPDENGTQVVVVNGVKYRGDWVEGNFYESKISGCFILQTITKTSKN
jgi:hypothetical protein